MICLKTWGFKSTNGVCCNFFIQTWWSSFISHHRLTFCSAIWKKKKIHETYCINIRRNQKCHKPSGYFALSFPVMVLLTYGLTVYLLKEDKDFASCGSNIDGCSDAKKALEGDRHSLTHWLETVGVVRYISKMVLSQWLFCSVKKKAERKGGLMWLIWAVT